MPLGIISHLLILCLVFVRQLLLFQCAFKLLSHTFRRLLLRYWNRFLSTCLTLTSLELSLLLRTTHSVYLQLIVNLLLTVNCHSSCIFLNFLSKNFLVFLMIIPSTHCHLCILWLCPKIINPGGSSSFLEIISLYRLHKSDEKTHPCLTLLFLCTYSTGLYLHVGSLFRIKVTY